MFNSNFLKRISAVAMITFVNAVIAPLAAAANTTPTNPFEGWVKGYQTARPVYDQKGLDAFLKALPKGFTETDHRFIKDEFQGVGSLPELTTDSKGRVVATITRGNKTRSMTLELSNPTRNEFLVDGKLVTGHNTLEANYKEIIKVLGVGTKTTWNPFNIAIPEAQASGASNTELLVGALIVIAAGLITYFVVQHYNKKAYDKGYENGVNASHSTTGTSTTLTTGDNVSVSETPAN